MNPAELEMLLKDVSAGVELVIGDRDVGIYHAPEINGARLAPMWKLVQENASGGPNYITYFENKAAGELEQSNSSLRCISFLEVECLVM